MRNFAKLFAAVALIAATVFSCGTFGARQSEPQPKTSLESLAPEYIVGKNLTGSDGDGAFIFYFSEDGTLEYTKNGRIYEGTWEYNASKNMLQYNLDWTEGNQKQGYTANVVKRADEVVIQGYWYLTDTYRTLFKTARVEERPEE